MSYSKSDVINNISEQVNLSKAEIKTVLDAAFAEITFLAASDSVAIHDFGVFKSRTRAARAGRNPQDGSVIQIAESTSMVFKATKHAK